MKILINTPDISLLGGVSNHYKGLKNFWHEDITYNHVGGRKKIPGLLILPFDFIKFFFVCLFGKYDLIVLNPSLGHTALKRDALFLKIASFFKLKTIVFIHGWDKEMEKLISKNPRNFKNKYQNSACFIVLSSEFKDTLIRWGFKQPIYLTTTKVDNSLIADGDKKPKTREHRILFLARIVREKGVFIALKAFQKVNLKFPDIIFSIVGDGEDLSEIRKIIVEEEIKNVEITGALYNSELISAFKNSSIYLFPSYYGEGMPTSVLEAMAFGLPIITRPVGGLVDFFENEKMGYLIDSLNSDDFAGKIIYFLNTPEKIKEIGDYNHRYAKQHFMASEVAKKMEAIFNETLQYKSK